jgi:hypothetical protein
MAAHGVLGLVGPSPGDSGDDRQVLTQRGLCDMSPPRMACRSHSPATRRPADLGRRRVFTLSHGDDPRNT